MKLILATDDGEVLDSLDITREEWTTAKRSAMGAHAVLSCLHAGEEAK